jgi:hypothetical protein
MPSRTKGGHPVAIGAGTGAKEASGLAPDGLGVAAPRRERLAGRVSALGATAAS